VVCRANGWLPPTEAKIEIRGITVWRLIDGKIREEWTAFNRMRALSQLLNQLKWPLAGLVFAVMILWWGCSECSDTGGKAQEGNLSSGAQHSAVTVS
jgi:hypothetical protein